MTVQRFVLTILVPALAIFALVGTVSAQEQEAEQLPDPGLAPDSTFYFLDVWLENITTALTFGEEAKAERHLAVANERLAEAQKMAEEENDEALQQAAERYANALEKFEERLEQLEDKEQVGERASLAASRHREALERIQERLQERQERHDEDDSADSSEAVEEAAKTRDSLRVVSAATQKHIEVLERVREHVGSESAREAIDRSVERSKANRERLLEHLEETERARGDDDAADAKRDAADRANDEQEREQEERERAEEAARKQAEEIAERERKAAEDAAEREREAAEEAKQREQDDNSAPDEPAPQTRTFTVTADDNGYSSAAALRANVGDTVRITFNVKSEGVYYGGLQFVSGAFDTGTIQPGGSKTVEFTAQETLTISAYWPASNVLKWTATVVVQ